MERADNGPFRLIVSLFRREPPSFETMTVTAIRVALQKQIEIIRNAGWTIDARCLQNDLDRSGTSLPGLLMTRDSVEEFLASIEEEDHASA